MLYTKDVVYAKLADGKFASAVYDRPYFAFGPDDAVKNSVPATIDGGKSLVIDGAQFIGTEPAEDRTKADVNTLVQDALTYLDAKYNKDKDEAKKDNPWILLLRLAERQEKVQISNPLRQGLKPMDISDAVKKMAKLLMAAGVAKSEEQATAAAKAALGIA
jgi:hypothetical protein